MALTADELTIVRAELGSKTPPTDDDLDDLHDLYGGIVGVVRHVWKSRLADLVANPASFTVSGEYGQNVAKNIDAIRSRLYELSGLPDDSNELPPVSGALPVVFFQLERAGQDR